MAGQTEGMKSLWSGIAVPYIGLQRFEDFTAVSRAHGGAVAWGTGVIMALGGKDSRCVGLTTTFMCWLSWDLVSLNLLQPSGHVQVCTGIYLPSPYCFQFSFYDFMEFDIVQSVLILYSEDKSSIFIRSYSLSSSNTTVLMYLSQWDRAIEKLILAHLIKDFPVFFLEPKGSWLW